MKKKIFLLAFLTLLFTMTFSVTKAGEVYSEGYYYYTVDDGSVTIVGFYGKNVLELDVPSMIVGYPVNFIATGAFTDAIVTLKLQTVRLPDTIMYVEEGAFKEGIKAYYSDGTPVNPTPQANFLTANVSIKEDLHMNFMIQSSFTDGLNVVVHKQNEDVVLTEKTYSETDKAYRFSVRMEPFEMADALTIDVCNGTTVLDTLSDYSVRKYCDNIEKSHPNDTNLHRLMADMLSYGAAAQTFSNYHTDDLADNLPWVSSAKSAYTDVTTELSLTDYGDDGGYFTAASLYLSDVVKVRFHIYATDTENLSCKIYKKQTGSSEELVSENAITEEETILTAPPLNYYDAENIYRAELLRDNVAIQSIEYSMRSYVASYQHSDTYPGLSELVKRLWCYAASAKTYYNKK